MSDKQFLPVPRPVFGLLCVSALLLSACGGGSKGDSSKPVEPTDPVKIVYFEAEPQNLYFTQAQESTEVSWKAENATECVLAAPKPRSVAPEGMATVNLTAAADLTLTCTRNGGVPATKSLKIGKIVDTVPGIVNFTVTPMVMELAPGALGTVNVKWDTRLMETCRLVSPEEKSLAVSGTQTVNISKTSDFKIFCVSAGQSFESEVKTVTVTSKSGPNQVIVEQFEATPETFSIGDGATQNIELEWKSNSPVPCQLSTPTVQEVAASGRLTVEVKDTTEFGLQCPGAARVSRKVRRLPGADQKPQITNFTVTPLHLNLQEGDTGVVTVTWVSVRADSCQILEPIKASVALQGSRDLRLRATSRIKMECVRNNDKAEAEDTVQVTTIPAEPPVIKEFTVSQELVQSEGTDASVTISWASEHADSCVVLISKVSATQSEITSKHLGTAGVNEAIDIFGQTTLTLTCEKGNKRSVPVKKVISVSPMNRLCPDGSVPDNAGSCQSGLNFTEAVCKEKGHLWDPLINRCVLNDPRMFAREANGSAFLRACFGRNDPAIPAATIRTMELVGMDYADRSCYGKRRGLVMKDSLFVIQDEEDQEFDLEIVSRLPRLRRLHISQGPKMTLRLESKDLQKLVGLPKLISLTLEDTNIHSLADLPADIELEDIQLNHSQFSDVASLKRFKNLNKVELNWTKLTNRSVIELHEILKQHPVTRLGLAGNQLDHSSIALLVESLQKLTWLNISENKLRLVPDNLAKTLQYLYVQGNPIAQMEIKDLPELRSLLVSKWDCPQWKKICPPVKEGDTDDVMTSVTLRNTGLQRFSITASPKLRLVQLIDNTRLDEVMLVGNKDLISVHVQNTQGESPLRLLNVSDNKSLRVLQLSGKFSNLARMYLAGNAIPIYELKDLPALTELLITKKSCDSSIVSRCPELVNGTEEDQVEQLILMNTGLEQFSAASSPSLKGVQLVDNPKLRKVEIRNSPALVLTHLDKLPELRLLDIAGNAKLKVFELTGSFPELRSIHLEGNDLRTITLQDLPSLTNLVVTRNVCGEPHAEKCVLPAETADEPEESLLMLTLDRTGLNFFSAARAKKLKIVNIRENQQLVQLKLLHNPELSQINLVKLDQLKYLDVSHNKLGLFSFDRDVRTLSFFADEGNPILR